MIAIGNGESRKGIKFPYHSVGCNALHRDFLVEHLICVDRRCVADALVGPNTENTTIYTRPEWIKHFTDPRVQLLPDLPYKGNERPDDPWHWGSGPFAVLLAAMHSDSVELIGFDLWGNGNLVNNVYKGSKNYVDPGSHAINPKYWIYQISKIFRAFPHKYFTIFNEQHWTIPPEWSNLDNVRFESLDILRAVQ